jgi:hypothetical protein
MGRALIPPARERIGGLPRGRSRGHRDRSGRQPAAVGDGPAVPRGVGRTGDVFTRRVAYAARFCTRSCPALLSATPRPAAGVADCALCHESGAGSSVGRHGPVNAGSDPNGPDRRRTGEPPPCSSGRAGASIPCRLRRIRSAHRIAGHLVGSHRSFDPDAGTCMSVPFAVKDRAADIANNISTLLALGAARAHDRGGARTANRHLNRRVSPPPAWCGSLRY